MQISEIKEYMKRNKITYEELANKTGLSKSTITKIFAGFSKYPRVDTMEAIERALGLSDDITAEDIANGWVSTKKVSLTPEEDDWLTKRSEILRLYGQDGLQVVTAMIDTYIKAKR